MVGDVWTASFVRLEEFVREEEGNILHEAEEMAAQTWS